MAIGRLTIVALALLVVGACRSAQPSPTTSASPSSAQPSPTTSVRPGDTCALATEPGPADEPPRGGEELIDTADWGGGRWRLCLADPLVASAEGTLWCVWSPDRSAVLELNPRPLRIGDFDYEMYVSLQGNRFEFHAMDLGGTIANYEARPGFPTGESPDDGRSGTLMFEVDLLVDPESAAPPGASPGYAGISTWQCADAPPPR